MWQLEPHLGRPGSWTPGSPPASLPRTITLLLPAAEEWAGVANAEDLTKALDEVAREHGMKVRAWARAWAPAGEAALAQWWRKRRTGSTTRHTCLIFRC